MFTLSTSGYGRPSKVFSGPPTPPCLFCTATSDIDRLAPLKPMGGV